MTFAAGVFKTACITAAGPTQDITSADLGSEVPKAAILAVTFGVTNNTAANGALFSIGITDGTNHRVCASVSENNAAGSNANNWQRSGSLILILNPATGAIVAQANFVAFIAGGIRIQWDTTTYVLPAAAYQIHGIGFGGSTFQCKVVNATSDGVPLGGTVVTGVGFRLHAIFAIGGTRGFDDVSRLNASVALGIFATDDGEPPNLEQAATVWTDPDNLNPTQELARSVSDRIYQNQGTGGTGSGLEVISVGPDGFRTQDKDGTSSAYAVGCLCMNFGASVRHAIINFQTPTVASAVSYPIPFAIQAGIFLPSLVGTLNVTDTGANAGATGIGFVSAGYLQAGLSCSANDAVFPSATRSRADDRVVLEMQETDTTLAYRGTCIALGEVFGLLEINYSNVTATAAQVWALVIGQGGTSVLPTAVPLVVSVPSPTLTVNQVRLAQPVEVIVQPVAPTLTVVSITHLTLLPTPVQVVVNTPLRGVFIEGSERTDAAGALRFAGPEAAQSKFAGLDIGQISYAAP